MIADDRHWSIDATMSTTKFNSEFTFESSVCSVHRIEVCILLDVKLIDVDILKLVLLLLLFVILLLLIVVVVVILGGLFWI